MEVPVIMLALSVAILLALAAVAALSLLERIKRRRRIVTAQRKAAGFLAARRGFAPGMVMHGNAVLARLEAERQRCVDFIDNLLAQVETAGRDLVEAERGNLQAQRERIAQLDEQIAPLREFEDLREADTAGASPYVPTGGQRGTGDGNEPGQRGGGTGLGAQVHEREHQYPTAGHFIVDGIRAAGGQRVSTEDRDGAAARLRSHGIIVESNQLVRASAPHNTTAEVPGLLPVSIVGQIMNNVDAARPFISSVGPLDLGGIPGTTFKRPTITQHVGVAKQAAEKDELEDGQFKVGSVTFTKDTYGGWANVSRQEIDWTSPAVWNALLTDFIEQYGLTTENAAADAFVTAVTQTQELTTASNATPTMPELIAALYGAATQAYQGSGRMPDHIWASLDWWATLGVLVDVLKSNTAGNGGGSNDGIASFAGNLLNMPRTIVPSFASGTLIVGVKSRTEVYEDRIGFLSVVEPKVLGVQLAYGGYMASGTIKPTAFCKIVNAA